MTTKEYRREIGMLLVELDKIQKVLTEVHEAIRATAADGTYDEALIRKAVSFELAEIIVSYRDSRSVARVIHGDETEEKKHGLDIKDQSPSGCGRGRPRRSDRRYLSRTGRTII